MSTKCDIIYYLEAVLVLKHLQRPGVVNNMTVYEREKWVHHRYVTSENTASYPIIGVQLHKLHKPSSSICFGGTRGNVVQSILWAGKANLAERRLSEEEIMFVNVWAQHLQCVTWPTEISWEDYWKKWRPFPRSTDVQRKTWNQSTSFVVRGFYLPRLEKTNDFAFSLSGQFKAFSHPPLAFWGKPFLLLNSVLCHCYKFSHLRSELHRSPERLLVCFQVWLQPKLLIKNQTRNSEEGSTGPLMWSNPYGSVTPDVRFHIFLPF